jgi:hypothetical protein
MEQHNEMVAPLGRVARRVQDVVSPEALLRSELHRNGAAFGDRGEQLLLE